MMHEHEHDHEHDEHCCCHDHEHEHEHHHHDHDHEHEHHHDHEHHHHDHGECHDPDCHCHDHEHHHHDHDECDDPNCSCHHHHDHDSPAARTAAGSFVLSCRRTYAGPVKAAELTQRLKKVFLDLGSRAAIEGIIPGHIKGAVAAGDGVLGISITRPDAVDLTPTGTWGQQETLTDYTVSVNVMLLSDVGIREDDLFAGL